LFYRRRRIAVACFIGVIILASPWYIRNYLVFGNPVWPLFFEGKYVHPKTNSDYGFNGIANVINPKTYTSVFFDFWIGAPNSGEDFLDNVETGRNMYPTYFEIGLVVWALVILSWMMLLLKGLGLMWQNNQRLPLISCIYSLLAIPFLPNARLIVFSVPFLVLAVAEGFGSWKQKYKKILVMISVIAFTGCTIAYAYTYNQIMSDYLPFYNLMVDKLPKDSSIIMPFTLQECLYYTGLKCVRLRNYPGGVPLEIAYTQPEGLPDYGITHVCCDSLYWDARDYHTKEFCTSFTQNPVINFSMGDAWGRCWSTQ
jgi:hypothetical protein